MEGSGELRGEAGAEHRLGQRRGALRGERLERQLAQRVVPAQVVAQPPELMRARDLVRAVGAEHEHGQLTQRSRERGEKVERGIVRPLEVVEKHHSRPLGHRRLEPAPDRLEERGAIALLDRLAKLRKQQREMRAQRPASREATRYGTHEPAQRGDDGLIGTSPRAAGAAEEVGVRRRDHFLDEARLAHTRLAGHEHQRAAAFEGLPEDRLQPRSLGLPLNQDAAAHRPTV